MNGAVADSMYLYGKPYGLNYGVSLPTLRTIAKAEGHDHNLARYLYRQQVRELRLAALHIADPSCVDTAEAAFWAEGIINSEIAEEAAFAMLRRSPAIKEIFASWSRSGDELLAYSALMASARGMTMDASVIAGIPAITDAFPDSRIIAQGAVAFLAAAHETPDMRQAVLGAVESLRGRSAFAARYVTEEMEWRAYPAAGSVG